jgi:SAM-dependent methyltransferase
MASRLFEDHCIRAKAVVPMYPFHNGLRISACSVTHFCGILADADFVQGHPSLSCAGMLCIQSCFSYKVYSLVPPTKVNFQHLVLDMAILGSRIRISDRGQNSRSHLGRGLILVNHFMGSAGVKNIYTTGDYLETTKTWHTEDSPWKASQICKILQKNQIKPKQVAEVGCGAGRVLEQLSRQDFLADAQFCGYDISPQSINLAQPIAHARLTFCCSDAFSGNNAAYYDLLMAIDVFEHVPDYMGFLEKCQAKATYKVYHIPLDIHVSSVLRNAFVAHRYTIGHIHYFTADSALSVLRDTGHEVVDYFYTNAAFDMFSQHPSSKKAIANVPRWILQKVSLPFTVRLLGGYSLLVLAK